MSATVTLIRKSDSTAVAVAEYKVLAAFKYPGAVRTEDDLIKIDGIDYVLSSLSSSGANAPVLIGSISFAEMNAGAAAATFAKTFVGAKPANKLMAKQYYKVTRFVSATLDTAGVDATISGVTDDILNVTGSFGYTNINQPYGVADITLTVEFAGGGNNPKDFTAGSVNVYAEFIDAPAIV